MPTPPASSHAHDKIEPVITNVRRVLVAEDDPDMRFLISHALRRDGYEVLEARNGMEVLTYLDEIKRLRLHEAPHAVVSDIRMPGLGGFGVARELRRAGWKIPIVLVTGFSDPDTPKRAAAAGATAVLDKPVDFVVLKFVLRWALGAGPRQHAYVEQSS
jgi:CheY-like chemotaxis protein